MLFHGKKVIFPHNITLDKNCKLLYEINKADTNNRRFPFSFENKFIFVHFLNILNVSNTLTLKKFNEFEGEY